MIDNRNELEAFKSKIEELEKESKRNQDVLLKFDLLCDIIADLQSKEDLRDIYKYIASKLHRIYKNTIVLYVSIDEESGETWLECVEGLGHSVLQKIISLTGFNPVGSKYKLLPEHNDYFRSGNFVEFSGGLHEFSRGEFPRMAAQAIQKIIQLNKIYTIGIKKDKTLLGAVHIFALHETTIKDIQFIEVFVKQAGIIVQKKILEQNLKESERKIRLILHSLPDMMFIQNIEGEYLDFYISDYIDTDAPPKVFVGQKIHSVLENETADGFIRAFNRAKTSGKMEFLEYSTNVAGSKHYYEARVIYYDQDKFLSTVRDITKRVNAQNKIVDQNAQLVSMNKDKDKFISILAHDLRNPFNSLLGFSELLQRNVHNYSIDKIEKQASIINSVAKNTFKLLEDILLLSRSQSGKIDFEPDHFNLYETCASVIEEINNQAQFKDISVNCEVPVECNVFTDVNLVKIVLRNLISNAINPT